MPSLYEALDAIKELDLYMFLELKSADNLVKAFQLGGDNSLLFTSS